MYATTCRTKEIRSLQKLTVAEVVRRSGNHLKVFDSCDGIHKQIADDMATFIKSRNKDGKTSVFILPVGPVGQYPVFLDIIHKQQISLKNCWFFYMDEYADSSGMSIPASHPLSFRGEMRRLWLDKLDKKLAVPENQLFFPDKDNIQMLDDKIKECGGVDMCFGGIGIHGHLAFNEPEPGVGKSSPRLVYLNDYTVTINAIRSKVGGNLEAFPRKAYTLGMKQIIGARKIRLACRNGIGVDWANTVLRLALFGTEGDDYPCTFVNKHSDYIVYTDLETLKQPEIIL
jgi:glucosamine-6-phosphate deaminase